MTVSRTFKLALSGYNDTMLQNFDCKKPTFFECMLKNIPDISVIGSGIIGLLTAKQMLQAGAAVTVFEKNSSSQEASWAGGGILLPLYPWRQAKAISALLSPSLAAYPLLNQELKQATGIDPEWTQCGLLITQNPDVETARAWAETWQMPLENATPELLNGFHSDALHPLWLPTVAQARNPRLLKSLRAFLVQQGVRFIDNCHVTGVQQKNKRVVTIKTSLGEFAVQHLILASGAWTGELYSQLFPECRMQTPQIRPVKGQMIIFDGTPNLLKFMVLEKDRYLIPRRDGKILAGSSVEDSGFDKTPHPVMKQQLMQFATHLLPALKTAPVLHHWAGLRPATHDGVPYIANHPEIENVSIHAGHFRNGLTLAPASTQLLADLILKRPPQLDPTPYQLSV